jgi:hypothetical protein
MIKTAIILIVTIMMVMISTTISSQTYEVYAENKAKELCSEYDGEWEVIIKQFYL